MEVLIIIDLLGQPGDKAYESLTEMMRGRLGWETQVTGANGVVAPLARAIYAGETELELLDLATNVLSQITAEMWPDGARVVVVQRLAWAGVGTA